MNAPTPVRPTNEAVIQPPKKEEMTKSAPDEATSDKPADQVPVATKMSLPTADNNLADNAKLTTASGDLQEIKRETVTELRPLVDKLDIAPADKFDVLLLFIRTTNDSSLIAKAHETATQIPDESRRVFGATVDNPRSGLFQPEEIARLADRHRRHWDCRQRRIL